METWKQDCPYPSLMSRNDYEVEKYLMQIELLKFQYWTTDTGAKHVILFEGRDAAGKGGTIKRFVEHLNPRAVRVVALTKPTSTEDGQWFFQRYVSHRPTSGEGAPHAHPPQSRTRPGEPPLTGNSGSTVKVEVRYSVTSYYDHGYVYPSNATRN